MKKVLFATVAAVMSTTAAMADVGFSEGRITALMTAANNFESRGINIVENSNKLAVHKTVTAWNQGWNAAEGNNTVDLDASYMEHTISHGSGTVTTDNYELDYETGTLTYNNGLGLSITLSDISNIISQSVSMRDSRAAEVVVEDLGSNTTFNFNGGREELSINEAHSFERLVESVETGIQKAYDTGFSDGYTAGYDDGFAAAKGVVKN